MRTYFPNWWIVSEWSPITRTATGGCLYHAPQRPSAEALVTIARHVQSWRGVAIAVQNSASPHMIHLTIDDILNPGTPTPDIQDALILARTRPSIPAPDEPTHADDAH